MAGCTMPIHRGAYYTRLFQITDKDGDPVPITGWTFASNFRLKLEDADPLLELTSASGGWAIEDADNGKVRMKLLAADTTALPATPKKTVIFDVIRTDAAPGPVWLFSGSVPVADMITRD